MKAGHGRIGQAGSGEAAGSHVPSGHGSLPEASDTGDSYRVPGLFTGLAKGVK